ncbi:protein O-linked-mannose beta-1,2-N-acetylglucosaminyltransferase 1 [Hyalella azteca]|uniref:Alpha-1,3-mannosyl-glycoprotein 2-beta-N-acetylglucosaminyltransferase n=1 Tax=Hyalella azteca TaxID=294128 RepID=A0A8B7PII4_HYAAZ|nr:protein O-linked-mannose beta-1,2-N-acetylglucosaminyltransferase 1 [Hyalella azteca]
MAAVTVVGGATVAESFSPDGSSLKLGVFSTPVAMETVFRLLPEDSCTWMKANQKHRARLCAHSDGYGDLCDCSVQVPQILLPQPKPLPYDGLRGVVVLVIAGNRPSSLYRCLFTLLTQNGVNKSRFLVSIDGHHAAVEALLDVLGIAWIQNDMSVDDFPAEGRNSSGFRISRHYIFSLEGAFSKFPEAQRVIIMEEDLLASPDFFDYFGQTAWLLDADPSLYCVSAWNDHGALHTSRDIRRLYRIETHPGYGWMMKRSYFEAVVQEWKNITGDHDWDIWMRSPHLRAERECVVPSVSRSFHYGIVGAHVNGVLTLAHFTGHLMSAARTHVHLKTEVLLQSNYERHIYELLLGPSTVYLNSTLSPCHPEMLPKNFTEGPLVVAFEMVSSDDHTAWARLGGCHGLWNLDTRGHHRGLFRFDYYNTSVMAVGYPFSEYSWILPPHVHVIRSLENDEEREELGKLSTQNRMRFRVHDLERFVPALLVEAFSPRPVYLSADGSFIS